MGAHSFFSFPINYLIELTEHLLSAATAPPSLTEEELAMIGYYVAQVQKLLPVSDEK